MPSHLPTHIAFIPDGNRRWAKQHRFSPTEGHRKGKESFKNIMRAVFRHDIPYMTFWAASEANLIKRSRLEVKFLVSLLHTGLISQEFIEEAERENINVRFFGAWDEILRDKKLHESIRDIEKKTAGFTKFHLTFLLGYDGRREMLSAINELERKKQKATDKNLRDALWTGSLPPVDLVVRTGEEDAGWSHWSAGFMMWQTAESQFYFTKTFWPAFGKRELDLALAGYAQRERRLGK